VSRNLLLVTLVLAAAAGCASSPFAHVTRAGKKGTLPFFHEKKEGGKRVTSPFSHDKLYSLLPAFEDALPDEGEPDRAAPETHPEIHGPYSLLLAGDFIAPGKDKLDEAYGLETRLLIRTVNSLYLGGSAGYARMKNDDTRGLIEGELQRYTALFWAEYRLGFGNTTWSPSIDFGLGAGWFVAEPVPLSERRKEIEAANRKLKVNVISTAVLRGTVQLRLPVLRATDMSIAEGNADFIIGIGSELGEGVARYSVYDFGAGVRTKSRGNVVLDAFHVFVGLSFRF
jgi:hypothetical protein